MVDSIASSPGSGPGISVDAVTDGGVANGVDVQRTKVGFGPNHGFTDVAPASPLPGYTPGGLVHIAATQFARPGDTATYGIGDLAGNSTTAGSVTGFVFPNAVRAAGEAIRIERVRLRKSTALLTNAAFRLYICRALPTLAVGDNGAFNSAGVLAIDSILNVIGWFDITMDRAATAAARGVGVPNAGPAITCVPVTGTTLFGLLEVTAAYAPGNAETFDASLEGQWS